MRYDGIARPLAGLRSVLLLWFFVVAMVTAIVAGLIFDLPVRGKLDQYERDAVARNEAVVVAELDNQLKEMSAYAQMAASRRVIQDFVLHPSDTQAEQGVKDYFENLRAAAGVQFLTITDVEGRVLLMVGNRAEGSGSQEIYLPAKEALKGLTSTSVEKSDGRIAVVSAATVALPVEAALAKADWIGGVITLGQYIDDSLAERFKRDTSSEILFLDATGVVGKTVDDLDGELVPAVLNNTTAKDAVMVRGGRYLAEVNFGTATMEASFIPLKNSLGEVVGVLVTAIPAVEESILADSDKTLIERALAISVFLALVLSLIVSKFLARPIHDLENQAVRMAEGKLNEPIKAGGYREIRSLGKSLEMLRLHLKGVLDEIQQFSVEMEEEVEERTDELSALFGASHAITASHDVTSRLPEILRTVIENMRPANAAAIFLYSEDDDFLKVAASVGFEEAEMAQVQYRPGEGLPGLVYRTRRGGTQFVERSELPASVVGQSTAENASTEHDAQGSWAKVSVVAVPLIVGDQCFGVLIIANVGSAIEGRARAAQILAGGIAAAIANSNLYRDLEQRVEELKKTQALLVQSEKMASIGQLAAGVAHEINNPIGFINSNLNTLGEYVKDLKELICKSVEVEERIKNTYDGRVSLLFEEIDQLRDRIDLDYVLGDLDNLVRESMEGTQRAKKIIQDLKTFSRADGGDVQPANLNSVMDSALNIVWNQLKYTCTVTKEYGELPDVRCNANQIGQVFVNILVNAGQAIEKDKHGEIRIRTSASEKYVCAEIADNGAGISPENLKKIFDPFFTTKPVGKGTGLGLSITYNIIEKHGGIIHARSEVGVGTTFTVELPLGTS